MHYTVSFGAQAVSVHLMCLLLGYYTIKVSHVTSHDLITHISSNTLEGDGYKFGVELVGRHAVDERIELLQ